MKRAAWFIVSELLLVLTIVLVFYRWKGNANFSLAWPVSGSAVNLTGGAQGGQVLLAFVCAILTVATFILGLVRLFQREKRIAPPAAPITASPAAPKTVPPPASSDSARQVR